MKISYIYVLRHPITNEIRYVGQTTRRTYRIKEHIRDAKQMIDGEYVNNRHVCKWIRKILRECNNIPPVFEIIDNGIDGEEADGLEIKYVNEYLNNGIKLTNLIGGGKKGYTVTNAIILGRMSESGIKTADRNKRKVGKYSLSGDLLFEFSSISEAGKSIIPYNKGIGFNISACCNNRSKTAYGFVWKFIDYKNITPKEIKIIKTQKKAILQYNLNGNFLKEYGSMTDASEQTGILNSDLSYCCSGKSKSAGGYQWILKNGVIEPIIHGYKITRSFEKPIQQYDLDNNFIAEYKTITEASSSIGISKSAFSAYFSKNRNTCGGFVWKLKL